MPLLLALNWLFAFLKENKNGYVKALENLRSLLKQDSSLGPIFHQDEPTSQQKEPLPAGSPHGLGERGGKRGEVVLDNRFLLKCI